MVVLCLGQITHHACGVWVWVWTVHGGSQGLTVLKCFASIRPVQASVTNTLWFAIALGY